MKKFVFVDGYGLVQFEITKEEEFQVTDSLGDEVCITQYKGKIKLPRNVYMEDGSKWEEFEYWFAPWEVYNTRIGALISTLFN